MDWYMDYIYGVDIWSGYGQEPHRPHLHRAVRLAAVVDKAEHRAFVASIDVRVVFQLPRRRETVRCIVSGGEEKEISSHAQRKKDEY